MKSIRTTTGFDSTDVTKNKIISTDDTHITNCVNLLNVQDTRNLTLIRIHTQRARAGLILSSNQSIHSIPGVAAFSH